MTLYTWHFTLYITLHSSLYDSHFTVRTLHFALYTPHSTLYTPHFTLYTLHSTPYTLHSTLSTPHSTLYTLHSTLDTLRTLRCTLHTPQSPLHTLHTTFPTQHSTIFTLHTSQSAPFPYSTVYTGTVTEENTNLSKYFFTIVFYVTAFGFVGCFFPNCCHCFSIFGLSDNISTFQPLKVKSWELHIWKLGWFPRDPSPVLKMPHVTNETMLATTSC